MIIPCVGAHQQGRTQTYGHTGRPIEHGHGLEHVLQHVHGLVHEHGRGRLDKCVSEATSIANQRSLPITHTILNKHWPKERPRQHFGTLRATF